MISVNKAAAAAPGPPGPGCAPAPRDDVHAIRDRQRSVCHRRVPRRVGTRRSSSCRSVWDGMSSPLAGRRPPGRRERRLQSSLRLPPLGQRTASGCACQRHAWTTRSRTRTMRHGGRTTGYHPGPPAARRLGANRRTPCCRQSPKQARGSVTTCASYPPIGLEGWAASDPDSPLTGSARTFTVLQHAAQTATPP
jgi:hypothetical protein